MAEEAVTNRTLTGPVLIAGGELSACDAGALKFSTLLSFHACRLTAAKSSADRVGRGRLGAHNAVARRRLDAYSRLTH